MRTDRAISSFTEFIITLRVMKRQTIPSSRSMSESATTFQKMRCVRSEPA